MSSLVVCAVRALRSPCRRVRCRPARRCPGRRPRRGRRRRCCPHWPRLPRRGRVPGRRCRRPVPAGPRRAPRRAVGPAGCRPAAP
ncbi:hypothetical protein E4099_24615 [Streptomyces palmae]|uniref:Uncharacterized protein n=1 Tax=Streptomyces palmae TaxID=1701085 RepID=A0A4Z0GH06_9ACTN|nr:hypothetical protein E4099_24615 [Streptomyces palmae]